MIGDVKKIFPKAIFTTNPCRIQYCTREIVVFRADLVPKFLQGTLHKPSKDEIGDFVSMDFKKIFVFYFCLN